MVCEMESFLSQVPAEFSDPEQLALETTVLNHEQFGRFAARETFLRPFPVNKTILLQQLCEHLAARIEGFERSAREAHAEATHEQNKAENKYDTRALEASYLAEGQTRQAAEVMQALETLESFSVRDFTPKDPVALGALVELDGKDGCVWYFLAPCAGGTELMQENIAVLVLTPHSPLGQQLMGRKLGEKLTLQFGKERVVYRLKSIV
jgi:transcription elongation GreA/GreB family factor